eukprot:scaffold4442_cov125-Amphora_coffeaeformis.AAC.26
MMMHHRRFLVWYQYHGMSLTSRLGSARKSKNQIKESYFFEYKKKSTTFRALFAFFFFFFQKSNQEEARNDQPLSPDNDSDDSSLAVKAIERRTPRRHNKVQITDTMPLSPESKRLYDKRRYREKNPPKTAEQKALVSAMKKRVREDKKNEIRKAQRALGKLLTETFGINMGKDPSKKKLMEAMQGLDRKEVAAILQKKMDEFEADNKAAEEEYTERLKKAEEEYTKRLKKAEEERTVTAELLRYLTEDMASSDENEAASDDEEDSIQEAVPDNKAKKEDSDDEEFSDEQVSNGEAEKEQDSDDQEESKVKVPTPAPKAARSIKKPAAAKKMTPTKKATSVKKEANMKHASPAKFVKLETPVKDMTADEEEKAAAKHASPAKLVKLETPVKVMTADEEEKAAL